MKIGLEIHIQLNTKSKLFCSCAAFSSKEQEYEKPNTRTCPICLGHPGAKPSLNKEAVYSALKVALALGCKINNSFFFSRKTYFYPDLPKNVQITQYEFPIAYDGSLEKIKIKRLHLEEDPGKSIHSGNATLIDYNRSGTPLIEVVTEPDFKSVEEVKVFLQKMITILEYLNVYSRKSEASIRTDVNVSVNGPRIEIKNINGIKDVERALIYEIEQQKKNPDAKQQTKAWDSINGKTNFIRYKETEEDYGYIFEPDLMKVALLDNEIEKIRKNLPELAHEKLKRFVKQYKIKKEDAEVLTSEILLANLYEKVAKQIEPILAAKWLKRELKRVLHYNKKELHEVELDEAYMIELLELIQLRQITEQTGQRILEMFIEKPFSPKKFVEEQGLLAVSEKNIIKQYCEEAIKENPKVVETYKAGKQEALHYLIGQVMKKTKGTATPKEVNEFLKELLKAVQ